jgi:predicted membrane-bound spermidine synthase
MKNKFFFFLIAFIEGFILMSVELTAGRMLNIYFGTSLLVWAFVLGITLLFLSLGYFLGAFLAEKKDTLLQSLEIVIAFLFISLIVASNYQWLIQQCIMRASFYIALGLSSIVLIGLPALCCGTITPLIIQLFQNQFISSKSISGKILGLSTIGGVLAVFLTAFYLLSQFGLKQTILLDAVLLLLPILLLSLKKKKYIALILFITVLAYQFYKTATPSLLYSVEGINGKIEVYDYKNEKGDTIRNLQVNQIIQTQWNRTKKNAETPYIKIISDAIDSMVFPMQKALNTALIIGYGGGALAKVIESKAFQVDGVELDKRIIDVSKTYFGVHDYTKLYNEDGRTFIRHCKTKYDVIVLDVFKGENLPFNLFTTEALMQIKKCLQPNGYLVINSNGYIDGVNGRANSAILSTLKQQQFDYKLKTTNANPDYANTIIFAKVNLNTAIDKPDYQYVLTDDKGDLDLLNANAAFAWRKNYLRALYQ